MAMRPSLGGRRRWLSSNVVVKTSIMPWSSPEHFTLVDGIIEEEPRVECEVIVEGEDEDDLRSRSRLDFSLEVAGEEEEALDGSWRCMLRWAEVDVGSMRRV